MFWNGWEIANHNINFREGFDVNQIVYALGAGPFMVCPSGWKNRSQRFGDAGSAKKRWRILLAAARALVHLFTSRDLSRWRGQQNSVLLMIDWEKPTSMHQPKSLPMPTRSFLEQSLFARLGEVILRRPRTNINYWLPSRFFVSSSWGNNRSKRGIMRLMPIIRRSSFWMPRIDPPPVPLSAPAKYLGHCISILEVGGLCRVDIGHDDAG